MILVSLENVKKCVSGGYTITSKTKIYVVWNFSSGFTWLQTQLSRGFVWHQVPVLDIKHTAQSTQGVQKWFWVSDFWGSLGTWGGHIWKIFSLFQFLSPLQPVILVKKVSFFSYFLKKPNFHSMKALQNYELCICATWCLNRFNRGCFRT